MTLDTGETVATCTADCSANLGGGGYRADVVVNAGDCTAALACTADEDQCLECKPTAAHEAYETACRAKATECGASPSDVDQICETTLTKDATGDITAGFFCIFSTPVMDALRACFEKTCAEIESCLGAVEDQYNLDL